MSTLVEYAEVARAETERGELVLRECREDDGPRVLELRANGVRVMDTREVGTGPASAQAALAAVDRPARVVVVGLGLGHTLREVLADSRVERAAVVEVDEPLVGWMRDGTVPHGPALLADHRVGVVAADVRVALAEARPSTYDLVLLDADHGPAHLAQGTAADREPLLESVRAVLRPGGAVAVWSSTPSLPLERTMAAVFRTCEASTVPVLLPEREETCWLYLGRT